MSPREGLELWDQSDARVERASGRAMALCCAVVAGNAALMAALAASPFPSPMGQLCAGSVAMGLHGWGAWEIGSALMAWSRASRSLAWQAAGLLRQQARQALSERAASRGPGPGSR